MCDFVDALEQCRIYIFSLAILGHSIPQHDKVALISEFKKQSDAPVLLIVRHGDAPLLQADYWVDASDGPEALVQAVKWLPVARHERQKDEGGSVGDQRNVEESPSSFPGDGIGTCADAACMYSSVS